ncbi:MAG: UDP-N-acetylmuramate dehydrogenase [Nitrososphaerales archaeon]
MGFQESVERLGMQLLRDEPLAKHTTFRIGGPAEWYATATTLEQLETLAELAVEHGLRLTVLGGGSNLLVSDGGIGGLVVANQARWHGPAAEFRRRWNHPAVRDDQLVVESGALLAGLARWAIRQGLAGLEWAVSVPGTVGGAVIGNAGAHGSDTAATLAWAAVRYAGCGRQVMGRDELRYMYRSSLLKEQLLDASREPKPVVLAAGFELGKGEVEELERRADEHLAKRRATQPVEPSAGSIFRNPPGDHAGRLIESLGLKGQRIGGAQVSLRHANFIVNVGNATAADVAALINLLREQVYQARGVRLTPEILFVGEWAVGPLSEL